MHRYINIYIQLRKQMNYIKASIVAYANVSTSLLPCPLVFYIKKGIDIKIYTYGLQLK